MDNLQIFNNSEFGEIRTFKEPDGSVTFCGADVAKVLGYSNTRDALSRHCKSDGVVKHDMGVQTGFKSDGTPATQNVSMTFITKGNLCRLAANSKLPGADKFESWIFDVVIPTVLEHGVYATADTAEKLLNDPDFLIETFTALKQEREKRKSLESTVSQQNQVIAELNPKASYYDVVLQTPDVISPSKIAKDYGSSAQWLNCLLHDYGIQFKQGGIWLLYQKYAEQGYTKSKTETFPDANGVMHSRIHTYWTQKGRLFIYQLLKEHGVLPLIEREDKIPA